MANTAWSLLMKLQGDASSLQRAVASSESSLRGLGQTTRNVGSGMVSSGRAMTMAVTAPILAAGVGAIKMASDYETAFAGVEKTLGGDWGQGEIAKLSDDIRKMAREDIPIAVTELAAIGEAGGAMGIGKNMMLEFIETTALLAQTTDLTSEAASTSLGHLNVGLQLTQGEFIKLGDALVFLGNRGSSTESEILGMAENFAGTAGLFDLTVAKTLGWSAALANVGEEAEAGGSSLSKFFQGTFKLANEGGKELELMAEIAGQTADDFQQAMNEDISGALENLIVGLSDLTAAEQLATLEALGFNDIRITRAILKLTDNTDNLTSSLGNAEEGFADSGAMGIEAAKRFETFASQMQFLKNELIDIGIEFGTMLLPIIREDVIPVLKDALAAVRGWVEWFKALEPEERKQVVMWAAIAAAMGPALFIAGNLLKAFGSILKVGGSLAGMLGGVGRLAGGGQGALSKLMAQPVFVTNWPPGMMAPGGGGLTGAAGRGFLGSVKAGLMAGMKWIAGPLAAVFAGWQIGTMLNEPLVAPARDFETGAVEAVLASNDSAKITNAIRVIEEQLATDNLGHQIALALDVNGVRSTLEAQLEELRAAKEAQEASSASASSATQAWTEEQRTAYANMNEKIGTLDSKQVIEELKAITEIGLANVGTTMQVGLKNGLDPLGDTATAILARAEDPKAPAVMFEIQGHIAGLEEIQAAYLATGDVHLAAKVQTNIDTLHALIGTVDANVAVTAAVRDAVNRVNSTIAAKAFQTIVNATTMASYYTNTGMAGSGASGGGTNFRQPTPFHTGAWAVGAGASMLHDDEMVIPAKEAKAFRSSDFWDRISAPGGGREGDTILKVDGLIRAETAAELMRPMKLLARGKRMYKQSYTTERN